MPVMTDEIVKPDYAAITARQRGIWGAGDYSAVAARIAVISERLCDAADLRSGSRVLDIAGGNGNTALAAARCGADVTSLDYVPELQENGRARARAEGLEVDFVAGDAQALPFADGSFDAVVSGVGVMFAPDQRRTAEELLRVCRADGVVALANWTPEGFIGGLLRTVGAHVPPPPGVASPLAWGTEERVRELLGPGVRDMQIRRRTYTFRMDSPEHFTAFFRANYGPTVAAFAALDAGGAEELVSEISALARRFDRLGRADAVAIDSEYLEVVAQRA